MAANVEIRSFHGGSDGAPSPADGTTVSGGNIYHKLADNDTADLNDQLTVPAPGSGAKAFAWRKQLKLYVATSPPTGLANLVAYFDDKPTGSVPSRAHDGIQFWIGVAAGYTLPTSADEAGPIAGLQDADVGGYSAATPLVVYNGEFIGATTGFGAQPFLRYQASVDETVLGGEKDPRILYYRFFEY